MKLIKPSVEFWETPDNWQEQVARAARICYASENGKKSSEDFCAMLKEKNHNSMFRHGSKYFIIHMDPNNPVVPGWLFVALNNTPFVGCLYHKEKAGCRTYFISTNLQYLMDNEKIARKLEPFEVELRVFVAKAASMEFPTALNLVRYTVCVTTQISTSRELNRTSPNVIAEQSTRFVNFGKKGGITIVLPHWYNCAHWSKKVLARVKWQCDEWAYMLALKLGLPPQDAREFLPLVAGTRVAYTYNVYEWQNIMRLRRAGVTGKPHPNAKISAQQIHDCIVPAMRVYGGSDAKLI